MDVIILRPEFLSTNNDLALITHKVLTSEHDKQPESAHVYVCSKHSFFTHIPLFVE